MNEDDILIFLNKFDSLPEEVRESYNHKKYKKLPRKLQNILIKEQLIKWGIAMHYCWLDYRKYLPEDIAKALCKDLQNIKNRAELYSV